MTANKYAFCYSYFDVIDEKGMNLCRYLGPKIADKKNMLLFNFIPCLTAIYDAKILGKFYQPNIKKRNDYALWLKILYSSNTSKAYCLEKVTASYRSNQQGLSSGNIFELLGYYWVCLRSYASVNKIYSIFLSVPYLLIMLVKKISPSLYNNLVSRF
jgi:teichuronic acid biosynthesis glycosyltransferase TuaG